MGARGLGAGLFSLGLVLCAGADTLAEQALLDRVQALHEPGVAGHNLGRCGTPLIIEARQTLALIRD